MAEEDISQAFRLNDIDKTKNYLIEEINELVSKTQKGLCVFKFY